MTDDEAVTAALYSGLYPSSTMAGIKMEPMADVSATPAPVRPAKKMEATTLAWASPPGTRPTMRWAKRTSRTVIPVAFISSPARMKKGMAISGKESIPPNILCGITSKEIVFHADRKLKDATARANAMGAPVRSSAAKGIRSQPVMSPPPPEHQLPS